MINFIPVIGWLLDFFFKASLAVPFWFYWTYYGLGEKYFYFLPYAFQAPPFWECVGLFVTIPILKFIMVPIFVSVSQTNNNAEGNDSKEDDNAEEDD